VIDGSAFIDVSGPSASRDDIFDDRQIAHVRVIGREEHADIACNPRDNDRRAAQYFSNMSRVVEKTLNSTRRRVLS
jgi:hypothetical protein